MEQPEGPCCDTCRRPLVPWMGGTLNSPKPKPEAGQAATGRYVCYSALCGKYGLVIKIESPSARGGSREA